MRRRVFALSDLHLGPGGPMTSFHEHERLSVLLRSWARGPALDELVLAGDVFDFLQVPGYDGFSATQSAARFKSITDHAPTAHVLTALRELAQRPNLELSVLAGNHDPELLLPDVRAAFEDLLGRRGSVVWADDTPLVPRDGNHLPLWGRAVHVPGAEHDLERQAWIVHGDLWDPQNVFDRDEVKRSAQTGTTFKLPLGSHLVFEVLAKIIHTKDRRWVAELKPELPVVVPLLLAYAPRETSSYLFRHLGLPPRMLVAALRSKLGTGPTMGQHPTKSVELDATELAKRLASDITDVLAAPLHEMSEIRRELLLSPLEPYLEHGPPHHAADTLGPASDVRDFLVSTYLRAVRLGGRFDDWGGPDHTPEHAARIVPLSLGALIAGHTHAARIRADLQPHYFNSGTWMPVRTLEGDLSEVLRTIEGPYHPVPSPGTFVRIELGDGQPQVAVMEAAL